MNFFFWFLEKWITVTQLPVDLFFEIKKGTEGKEGTDGWESIGDLWNDNALVIWSDTIRAVITHGSL